MRDRWFGVQPGCGLNGTAVGNDNIVLCAAIGMLLDPWIDALPPLTINHPYADCCKKAACLWMTSILQR